METVPLLAEGKGRGRAKESSESSIEKKGLNVEVRVGSLNVRSLTGKRRECKVREARMIWFGCAEEG